MRSDIFQTTTIYPMKKYSFLMVFILGFLLEISCQGTLDKAVQYPDNYNAKIDVVYSKVLNWEGRMDIYHNPESEKPTPIVINIHGGGWNHGRKESQTGFGSFFKQGFAIANVEYRLVDVSPAPGAIEDVRCALVYLCKHAEELNIDPEKIVIMGASAGGHLALMAGLLNNDKIFDSNCDFETEIKIAAIIDKYGPTDLWQLRHAGSVKKWLGDKHNSNRFIRSVSPINYVDENSPPVLVIHGTKDPLIPYKHSVLFYDKLMKNNVKTELVTIKGGKHGKFSKEQKAVIKDKMWNFLKELKLTEN